MMTVACSHWRDCHFDDTPCLSLLKHLLKSQGGAIKRQSHRRLGGAHDYVADKFKAEVPDDASCRAACDSVGAACTGYSYQSSNGGFCFVYGEVASMVRSRALRTKN